MGITGEDVTIVDENRVPINSIETPTEDIDQPLIKPDLNTRRGLTERFNDNVSDQDKQALLIMSLITTGIVIFGIGERLNMLNIRNFGAIMVSTGGAFLLINLSFRISSREP